MGKKTSLYEEHVALGAKIVDFFGWDMPLHYGSQIDEHYKVRGDAGMFDVSHMTIIDLKGPQVRDFLRNLLANNIDRLQQTGQVLYSCMLNEQGGVIDDLIAYYLDDEYFRLVINASTRDRGLAWIEQHAKAFAVEVEECTDLAIIAVQGPNARDKVHKVLDEASREAAMKLAPFHAVLVGDLCISRTGYTGEDGYEIILPEARAPSIWRALRENSVFPTGLGARDTLRLEAGMNLYGSDMDETKLPMEAGLGWTVAWVPEDRNFIGRSALEAKRNDAALRKSVALILDGRGVLRSHQKVVVDGKEVGEVTSGSFSPTLGKAIAFACVAQEVSDNCQIEMRGKQLPATIVKPPFVRHGKPVFE